MNIKKTISKNKINIEIQALERMIDFYVVYGEEHGVCEYTTERLNKPFFLYYCL